MCYIQRKKAFPSEALVHLFGDCIFPLKQLSVVYQRPKSPQVGLAHSLLLYTAVYNK